MELQEKNKNLLTKVHKLEMEKEDLSSSFDAEKVKCNKYKRVIIKLGKSKNQVKFRVMKPQMKTPKVP